MWQSLVESTRGEPFTVIAVALDTPEAARPWIEAAAPGYPCLIDSEHRTAELYNFSNVPQATWIDEHGRIVRPPENAGQSDAFRQQDRRTGVASEAIVAERLRIKTAYVDAVRDWARQGAASRWALDEAGVMQRLHLPDPGIAEAHARFRLGQALLRDGRDAEARQHLEEAARLHPESWAIWRQHAARDARGLAATAEFWARVDALGDRPYHRPLEIGRGAGSGSS